MADGSSGAGGGWAGLSVEGGASCGEGGCGVGDSPFSSSRPSTGELSSSLSSPSSSSPCHKQNNKNKTESELLYVRKFYIVRYLRN